jgi:hypothetical protein
MPNVTLKRSVDFEFGSGKPPLKPGNHFLTEEQMRLWFVPGLVQSGEIIVHKGSTSKNVEELVYKDSPNIVFSESSKKEPVPVVEKKASEVAPAPKENEDVKLETEQKLLKEPSEKKDKGSKRITREKKSR